MNQHLTNSDIFQLMEEWAPKRLAYDWDNVGLQIGSHNKPVKKIMITLDVLESVVDEAIAKDVNLIIAHHPLLFKSIKQVNMNTPQGRIIQKLIKHDITVYAAHTNLDAANGGVNDMLCNVLGIESDDILIPKETEQLYKIVIYVPLSHVGTVRKTLGDSGAGHIGNYSHCTFQTQGEGTFKPLEGTNPYIGKQGEMEFVDEVRMETIVPESKLTQVIQDMIDSHPYEEPAYDIYPVKNEGRTFGLGRIGTIPEVMNLKSYSEHVKKALEIPMLRVTGDLTRQVKRIAVLGGSGEKYIHHAKRKGADVYITGDMSFHTAQDAWQMGLAVIDPGHYMEKVMKKATKDYLDGKLNRDDVKIVIAASSTEPFQFI